MFINELQLQRPFISYTKINSMGKIQNDQNANNIKNTT